MAGIYIHIPFCKKRCIYCDFYSTTDNRLSASYIDSLCKELLTRINEVGKDQIYTIYIGGGTPSQLTVDLLSRLINFIKSTINFSKIEEFTIEVNPDDVTFEYIKDAVTLIKKAGITNISIDLIYGLPLQTTESWVYSIESAIKLNVPHISCYNLSYEEGTTLYNMREKGGIVECGEEYQRQQSRYIVNGSECPTEINLRLLEIGIMYNMFFRNCNKEEIQQRDCR